MDAYKKAQKTTAFGRRLGNRPADGANRGLKWRMNLLLDGLCLPCTNAAFPLGAPSPAVGADLPGALHPELTWTDHGPVGSGKVRLFAKRVCPNIPKVRKNDGFD